MDQPDPNGMAAGFREIRFVTRRSRKAAAGIRVRRNAGAMLCRGGIRLPAAWRSAREREIAVQGRILNRYNPTNRQTIRNVQRGLATCPVRASSST